MIKSFSVNKIKIAFLSLLGLAVIIGLVFFIFGYLKPKYAGIYIETTPESTVYINGEQVGKTPYRKTLKPEEAEIRLVPDSYQTPLYPFETKVQLVAGVETVIKREFGELDETSSGETISFEAGPKEETSLSVITIPDSAKLVIDGKDRAFTPHKTSAILPGTHVLDLAASGYSDKEIQVKTYKGYRLTAYVKLAKKSEEEGLETNNASNSAQLNAEEEKEKVEIKSTPTGFLRVRDEPSSLGNEIGRVVPGEQYVFVEEDKESGWYKIEFNDPEDESKILKGWISNQYAKLIEAGTSVNSATSSAEKS